MRQRLLVHISWTTRDRVPQVDREIAEFLCKLLPIICRQERARLDSVGIVKTHVHALVWLDANTQIPRLLQRLKGTSSAVANKQGLTPPTRPLRWARGYDIESVSPKHLESARRYLRDQPLRHRKEAIEGWISPCASAHSAEDGLQPVHPTNR